MTHTDVRAARRAPLRQVGASAQGAGERPVGDDREDAAPATARA